MTKTSIPLCQQGIMQVCTGIDLTCIITQGHKLGTELEILRKANFTL